MKSLLLIPILYCFLPCVIGGIKLDIPEEIYPPKFLTQIKKGKVPYYANDADLQQYHAWLSEFLASDVVEKPIIEKTTKEQFDRSYPTLNRKPLKGHSNLSEISAAAGVKCSAFYEAIVNSTADEIREMSLGRLRIFCINDDDSVNSSLPRSFWSKINGTFCTVKRECSGSNGAGRKTSIVCADHNAEFYSPLTHLEESDFGCKNSPLEMIQVFLSENSQKEIKTRYELSWGRFHCPSEITCLEELLFDFGTFFNHQQNEVTKWLLNTFIFLIAMFFTKEICDRLL